MMASPSLPPFVEAPGRQSFAGPVQFNDAKLSAFLLDADLGALRALCDRMIAAPSGGQVRFTPLVPKVVMTFADFQHARFVGDEGVGSAMERELSFSIPGLYRRFEHGFPVEAGFAVFMPFMFLDNPVAVITGREKYGYFKDFGQIGLKRDGPGQGFSADVYGCAQFDPNVLWGNQRLLTLSPTATEGGDAGLGTIVGDVARNIADAVLAQATEALTDNLLGNLLSGRVAQVFLKQFRDIQDGTQACYQAITLAHYTVEKVKSLTIADRYKLDLKHLDSAPVASELGLGATPQISSGFEIVLEMRLEDGRVLFQR